MWTYALLADSGPVALDAERSAGLAGSLKKERCPAGGPDHLPNEWMWSIAAWPHGEVRIDAVREARSRALELRREAAAAGGGSAARVAWSQAGPVNIGGRITDLALDPGDPQRIFVATAAGGLFRSLNGGASWEALFQDRGALAVGDIALDPSDPQVLYLGTGEANSSSFSFPGDGLWRSGDAGLSWEHLGLEDTRYIGRVLVDPTDPLRIWVAALGRLYGTGTDRGVYRSEDGGANWEQVLFVSDSTACSDLAMDPTDPDRLYACMWERTRYLTSRRSGGPTSGLWRTTDGGDTWQELGGGLPQGSDVGRPGVAVAPSDPQRLYAVYADDPGYFLGAWRSDDGGDSWTQTDDSALSNVFSSFGWYFGNVRVAPDDPDVAYVLGVTLWHTLNGGDQWTRIANSVHVDHHGLETHPQTGRIWDGNDGGLYYSDNGGYNWTHVQLLPISQFYKVEIDPSDPALLFGGTQDNGTLRTVAGQVDDWEMIFGGDGFFVLVRPDDPQTIYAEYQWGNLYRSTDGGDHFYRVMDGISGSDRRNWNTPVAMDPADPDVMYYGSYRLYRSLDGGDDWSAISGDLTGGNHGGSFGTITSIDVSPIDSDVIWTGSDDGEVHVRTTAAGPWQDVSAGLTERWVTRVQADPHHAEGAVVSLGGLRWEDPEPHIYRTWDFGQHWAEISGDLPDAPVYCALVDPQDSLVVWAATETGCYWTFDGGQAWHVLGEGLPLGPVLDLDFHPGTRMLVAGTHGRSLFTLSVPDPPSGIPELAIEILGEEVRLSWPAVEGASAYRVYGAGMPYFPATGEYLLAETTGTEWILGGQLPLGQMYYVVRAVFDDRVHPGGGATPAARQHSGE